MKLTILGSASALFNTKLDYRFPAAHLVETENSKILLDCGLGVLPQLTKLKLKVEDIETICVTHFHADHFTLQPLMLEYFLSARSRGAKPNLHIVGPKGIQQRAIDWFNQSNLNYNDDFRTRIKINYTEYEDRQSIQLTDNTTLTPFRVEHYGHDAYAIRLEQNDKVLTYSGDSTNNPSLIQAAQNTDLFLCEASITIDKPSDAGHLNPQDAGLIAQKASAKQLILTHYSGYDPVDLIADSARKSGYVGEISVANDLDIYQI